MTEYKKKMLLKFIKLIVISTIMGIIFGFFLSKMNSTSINYTQVVIIGGLTGFFISLTITSIEFIVIFYYKNPPISFSIFILPLIYTFFIVFIYSLIYYLVTDIQSLFEVEAIPQSLLFSLLITFVMKTSTTINQILGQKVFIRLLLKLYHKPVKERRFIMFLDLVNSTSIAEQIGDKAFHGFLRDFFTDITIPILENKAEIYKYVGDEVILTWKSKQGVLKNNALSLVFDIDHTLKHLREHYNKKYGVFPEYRAGLHFGEVLLGEMGTYKMEVAFIGDVMNTAARIQSACKEYNVNFLISENVLQQYQEEKLQDFKINAIGSIQLKGKTNKMELFNVIAKSDR